MNEVAAQNNLSHETLTALVLNGDLSRLSGPQKVEYYRAFCERVGLDPATQPFKIMKLQGKETLYCDRGGSAQLNKLHKVSHKITDRQKMDELYVVTANASTPDGRCSESIGAVSIAGLKGEALANAMMKGETKAKRRSTLDLLGLGMLDESETGSIPGAQTLEVGFRHTPSLPPASKEEEKEEKEFEVKMRKARASLNALLQSATDEATFKEARAKFRKDNGLDKDIWQKRTFHNETEIFNDLVVEHWGRIDRDIQLQKSLEAVVTQWKLDLSACPDLTAVEFIEATFNDYPILRDNVLYLDMLKDKKRDLGWQFAEDSDLPF